MGGFIGEANISLTEQAIYGEHHPGRMKATPLDLAAAHDDHRMGNMLMEAGAKLMFKGDGMESSLNIALQQHPEYAFAKGALQRGEHEVQNSAIVHLCSSRYPCILLELYLRPYS